MQASLARRCLVLEAGILQGPEQLPLLESRNPCRAAVSCTSSMPQNDIRKFFGLCITQLFARGVNLLADWRCTGNIEIPRRSS